MSSLLCFSIIPVYHRLRNSCCRSSARTIVALETFTRLSFLLLQVFSSWCHQDSYLFSTFFGIPPRLDAVSTIDQSTSPGLKHVGQSGGPSRSLYVFLPAKSIAMFWSTHLLYSQTGLGFPDCPICNVCSEVPFSLSAGLVSFSKITNMRMPRHD